MNILSIYIFEKWHGHGHLPLQESNLKYTLYIGEQQSFFNKEYIITLKTHYLFEDDFHYFN